MHSQEDTATRILLNFIARFGSLSLFNLIRMTENKERKGVGMNTYDYSQQSEDFQRIEKAIQFIEENFKSQPTLDQMAQSVHLRGNSLVITGATTNAASRVNSNALEGMWRLKSTKLWTRMAVMPDIAPRVIPRTTRLGFFSL